MPRILLAGLFHETHTFVDDTTGLQSFATLHGDDMLARQGDGSPLGGFLEAASQFGWEVIPTVDMRASPSGLVEDEVVECWWMSFVKHASAPLKKGVDAIYLILHGAMVSRSMDDVEGEVLERIRALEGAANVPIFGVFDLHAHFTARMARHANCLVAYRENPHADACAMAVHAAELLHRCLVSGETPRQFSEHARVMWPPTGTGTAESPMRDLETLARKLETEHPAFLSVNVVAGFAFADTPDTGVSFCISSTGEESSARRALDALCSLARDLRWQGNAIDTPLDTVLAEVLQPSSQASSRGPLVIVEPSDNIGGGAPGDGTGLLRAFVEHRVMNAAICLNDPEAVKALEDLSIGASATLSIGGKGSRLDAGPLTLSITLVSRSSGHFELEDKQSHLASMSGSAYDMGACAVVRHEGITILLTSHKTPPFDLGQWHSQGVDLATLSVIGVKAAVAHRRAYDKIASRMLWVDTPGPCRSDLTKLPFKKVRRPIFPLDS